MKNFGLSYDEINEILKQSIASGKSIDSEGIRDVISKAIVENNNKILKDINKLLTSN